MSMVAAFIIARPDAKSLATPVAPVVGHGIAAEYGIPIRSVEVIQSLKNVETTVYDKAGTLSGEV